MNKYLLSIITILVSLIFTGCNKERLVLPNNIESPSYAETNKQEAYFSFLKDGHKFTYSKNCEFRAFFDPAYDSTFQDTFTVIVRKSVQDNYFELDRSFPLINSKILYANKHILGTNTNDTLLTYQIISGKEYMNKSIDGNRYNVGKKRIEFEGDSISVYQIEYGYPGNDPGSYSEIIISPGKGIISTVDWTNNPMSGESRECKCKLIKTNF